MLFGGKETDANMGKERPFTLFLKTIDKNVRNRLSTIKRQGDRKMDAGLGVWFGSRR